MYPSFFHPVKGKPYSQFYSFVRRRSDPPKFSMVVVSALKMAVKVKTTVMDSLQMCAT